jgi:Na+-translocating ferredoxin:NAD+ oxidoreductase subunit E
MMSSEPRGPSAALTARGRTAVIPELAAAIVPSLAAAATVSAALWLSAAALLSLLTAALVGALAARRLPPAVGSLTVFLAAAALAAGADLAASAWLPSVHDGLGMYLPLTVIVMSGPVAAGVLSDARPEERTRRAVLRALAAGTAFLGGVGLTALAREAFGAGTLTLPGAEGARVFGLPGLSEAPARGLLAPFAGLIAAGYLAGLVAWVASRVSRRAGRKTTGAVRLPAPGEAAR